jgi:DUF917 family protein
VSAVPYEIFFFNNSDRVIDAMKGVMEAAGLTKFDSVIPNEIGGMNAFEALLAAHRLGKSTLDTDLVARAYPKIWQTVRCLKDISVTPAAVANGVGKVQVQQDSISEVALLINIHRSSKLLATTLKQKT